MSYITDLANTLAKSGKAVESLNPLNEIAYITKSLGTSSAYAKEAIGFWNARIKPVADTTKPVVEKVIEVAPVAAPYPTYELDNGVIDATVSGYDPGDYSAASSAGSTISGQTIFGYVVVGLVAVVILDRMMK
jgi:hypothetical protein